MYDIYIYYYYYYNKYRYLGSAQSDKGAADRVLQGEYAVVYVTPEFITNRKEWAVSIARGVGLCVVAIDEA